MPDLALTHWDMLLLALSTAVLAGHVRGITGFGGPAIMMLVLTQFYSPASVLILVLIADYLANLQLVFGVTRTIAWRTAGPLTVATAVSLPLGLYALHHADPILAKRAIATVTGVCSVLMLLGWRYRSEPRVWVTSIVGLLGGAIVGATFIALPIMIFLFAGPAAAAVSRANALTWGILTSSLMILAFAWQGKLGLDDLAAALVVTAAYMAGAYAGSRIFRRLSETAFRRIVLICLVGLSLIGLST